MYNISKELFEAVIDREFIGISDFNEIKFIEIDNDIKDVYTDYISIDTFFFKCKEWAVEQGYELLSGAKRNNENYICTSLHSVDIRFDATTEQQAVFDATDYIRKELLNEI